jgi:hypothetical protein
MSTIGQIVTTRTLAQLKQIVSRNLNATLEAGQALQEIRDRELWKEEADSFQAFCIDNWGVTRQRAYQLIGAAVVVQQLPAEVSTAVDSERAARELGRAPAEARESIIQHAKGENGKVTGPAVAKAVKEHAAALAKTMPDGPPPVYDRTGFPIPQPAPAMTTWLRAEEVQTMLTALTRIKSVIVGSDGGKDLLYAEINMSTLIADLTSSYSGLKVAMPYAVCPTCQGRVLSPCDTCNGRGMISEFYWKHKVPDKTKEIRERAVEAMLEKKKGKK